eukprot:CAMPEP_0179419400 /NCGR_PEP_ID=MMETSP0799-20121207/8575_1 /TAXON_ID=46947 /ORGANISM="Geminigera cryophila, Strain CCMP2564" /LENGTH=50 /DNA_ID=CAMNT_0021192863 /DNA_START=535 /DNA_END=687 /DNA_ORIENTATION=+
MGPEGDAGLVSLEGGLANTPARSGGGVLSIPTTSDASPATMRVDGVKSGP